MVRVEQDPFIGQRFGEEGQLEVIGKSDRRYRDCFPYYFVHCTICKNDPELHGDAIYECFKSALNNGKYPCGCSSRPFWSQAQYRTLINRACEKKRVKLISADDIITADSKLTLCCEAGHIWSTTKVVTFVRDKHTCASCSQRGFDKNKAGYVYILKICSESQGFTGYGITGNLNKRLSTHARNLKKLGMSIVDSRTFDIESGTVVQEVEESIKKMFPTVRQNVEGFAKEATYLDLYEDVVTFVEEKICELI
jgi:hypothetical protein